MLWEAVERIGQELEVKKDINCEKVALISLYIAAYSIKQKSGHHSSTTHDKI